MKVWAWTTIDWDLLRDDPESAESIAPWIAYTTREKAEASLVEYLNELVAEVTEDEEFPQTEVGPIEWKEMSSAIPEYHTHVEILGLDVTLYRMRVE